MICCQSIDGNQCDSYSELHDDGGDQAQCRYDAEEPVALSVKDFRCVCNDDFDDSVAELPLSGFHMTSMDEIATISSVEVHPPFRRCLATCSLRAHDFIPVKDVPQNINEDYVHRLLRFKDEKDGDTTEDCVCTEGTEGSEITREAGTADLLRAIGDQDTDSEQAELLCASSLSETPKVDVEDSHFKGWPQARLASAHMSLGRADAARKSCAEVYSKGWPRNPLWSYGRQKCTTSITDARYVDVHESAEERYYSPSCDLPIPIAPPAQKPQNSLLNSRPWPMDSFSTDSYPAPKIVAVL